MLFPPPIPSAYVPPPIPWGYTWLNHVVQVVTIAMALLALTRLRPAHRRRAAHQARSWPEWDRDRGEE